MAKYELISARTCPYVQRVAIVLREKQLDYDHRTIDLANKPDWFLEISPFGKVPLLRTPDGVALFESQVINEYLDEVEGPRLHPEDPLQRAENRAWIELISSCVMSFGGYYYADDQATAEDRIGLVRGRFERLEDALGDGPYFNGADFSLVDAAVAPLFSRIDLLQGFHDIGMLSGFPKIATWSAAVLARPSVQAIATPEFQEDVLAALRKRGGYIGQFLAA